MLPMSQTEADAKPLAPKVVGQIGSRDLHRLYPQLLVMYDFIERITLSVQGENIKNRPLQVELMTPFVVALTAAIDSMTNAFTETLQNGGAVTDEAVSIISDGFVAILSAQIEFCAQAEEKLLDVVHKAPEPAYQVKSAKDVIALFEFTSRRMDKLKEFLGRAVFARSILTDEDFVIKFIEDSIAEDPKITWEVGYVFLQREARLIKEEIDREFSFPPRLASVAPFTAPVSSH
jgi:hypothetical protein